MKLFRLHYSPYARKVQLLLDLLEVDYEVVEVSYSDRTELAQLTGGYIYVPVLLEDDGRVTVESRDICERLLAPPAAAQKLTPSPNQGPIWAYSDFCDGPLEDVLFRIASPVIRDNWSDPGERALYTLIKERKFGAGCVEQWARDRDALFARGRKLLAPTLATLAERPFLFGGHPTLADAALYGNLAMLHAGNPDLVTTLTPELDTYRQRLEAIAQRR